jgi:hypothetical protein
MFGSRRGGQPSVAMVQQMTCQQAGDQVLEVARELAGQVNSGERFVVKIPEWNRWGVGLLMHLQSGAERLGLVADMTAGDQAYFIKR